MMEKFAYWLWIRLMRKVAWVRVPDFIIGADNPDGAYLHRWWVIPRNRFLNVYLHNFLRDDDDRALHDHPWPFFSLMLEGSYIEHTIRRGGTEVRKWRKPGSMMAALPGHAYRVELLRELVFNGGMIVQKEDPCVPCWTLFITGPRLRAWGFHCPKRWVPWQEFTRPGSPGDVGPGCGE